MISPRVLLLPLLVGALSCTHTSTGSKSGSASESPSVEHRAPLKPAAKNVGIVVFPEVFITEFVGPLDIYKHAGDAMNVFTVAANTDAIKTYEGVWFHADYAFSECPKIDVLVVPSGNGSMTTDLANAELVDFVKSRAKTASYVTSHCWGAFTLGAAGCLDGKESTTFPGYTDQLAKSCPKTKIATDRRFVVDGNVITSSGGLAASEASLYVVEKLLGKATADKIATGLVFSPDNRRYASDPRIASN